MPSTTKRATSSLALAAWCGLGAAACGPTTLQIEPKEVAGFELRPVSGPATFCPGDAIHLEALARLTDGTTCSTHNPNRGCRGETNAILDPALVQLEGSHGRLAPGDPPLSWRTPEEPLETAATGVDLSAWLKSPTTRETSMAGKLALRPIYDCRLEGTFFDPLPASDEVGAAGPDLDVAITTLATPFYPDAALVRVEAQGRRHYFVSPSPQHPVRITTRGQQGRRGADGAAGADGAQGDGAPLDMKCGRGARGKPGEPGAPGERGGDGGPGGAIRVRVDARHREALLARVRLESVGGSAGEGGRGGAGGAGGPGGKGGPTTPECADTTGQPGEAGSPGVDGAPGADGAPGPAPEVESAARGPLFARELSTLEEIEAAASR